MQRVLWTGACLLAGFLAWFAIVAGSRIGHYADGDETVRVTIDHPGGGSTTFAVPPEMRKWSGTQAFVLDIPLDGPGTRASARHSAYTVVRSLPVNGHSYAAQLLAGKLSNTTEVGQVNGVRFFERNVAGMGETFLLYVFADRGGNPVLVENWGNISYAYSIYHDVPGRFIVKVGYPKALGDDFAAMDEKVMRIIEAMIVSTP
ncbi:hypothetical protein [Achromobacter pestifer]